MNKETWEKIVNNNWNQEKNWQQLKRKQQNKKTNFLLFITILPITCMLLFTHVTTNYQNSPSKVEDIKNNDTLYINEITPPSSSGIYDCEFGQKFYYTKPTPPYIEKAKIPERYTIPDITISEKKEYQVTYHNKEHYLSIFYTNNSSTTSLRTCTNIFYEITLNNMKKSSINNTDVIILRYKTTNFITFNYQGNIFDIISDDLRDEEIKDLLKSIIKERTK